MGELIKINGCCYFSDFSLNGPDLDLLQRSPIKTIHEKVVFGCPWESSFADTLNRPSYFFLYTLFSPKRKNLCKSAPNCFSSFHFSRNGRKRTIGCIFIIDGSKYANESFKKWFSLLYRQVHFFLSYQLNIFPVTMMRENINMPSFNLLIVYNLNPNMYFISLGSRYCVVEAKWVMCVGLHKL